jgi:hypothetical protein
MEFVGWQAGLMGLARLITQVEKQKIIEKNMRESVQGMGSRSVNWPKPCTSSSNYFEVLKGRLSSSLKHIYSISNKGMII